MKEKGVPKKASRACKEGNTRVNKKQKQANKQTNKKE